MNSSSRSRSVQGSFTVYGVQMILKAPFAREYLVTLFTRERLCVSFSVLIEMCLCVICLVTYCTLEWLFVGVRFHVFVQLPWKRHSKPTLCTLKRSLACVNRSHVRMQLVLPRKCLVALPADEWLLACVYPCVSLQVARGEELSVTLVTGTWLFSSMCVHVPFQAISVCKRRTTLITLVGSVCCWRHSAAGRALWATIESWLHPDTLCPTRLARITSAVAS